MNIAKRVIHVGDRKDGLKAIEIRKLLRLTQKMTEGEVRRVIFYAEKLQTQHTRGPS